VTSGSPTIYLQAPDGKVLHRQDDYRPGDLGAIRKAIARYDAKKDPDARRPAVAGLPLLLVMGGAIALAAVLVLQRLTPRSKS
jgi:hypothetical protein